MPTGAPSTLTIAELRAIDLFAGLSHGQLQWLVTIGRRVALDDGEVLFARGEPGRAFYVLLHGELVFTVTAEDGTERFLTRHVRRDPSRGPGRPPGADHDGKPAAAHQFTGEMPLLLGIDYVATATAIGPTAVARYDAGEFAQLLARCPEVSRILLPVLAWRIHASEAQAGHRATLNALATLTAGLAHELNNPAAAVVRSAGDLRGSLPEMLDTAVAWGAGASPAERALLDAIAGEIRPRGTIAGADTVDDLIARLEAAGIRDADELAEELIEYDIPPSALDRLLAEVRPALAEAAVTLLATRLRAATSAGEVFAAAQRITALVEAARAYTNLDLAPERDFDLTEGLEATLTILAERLDRVTVRREFSPAVPRVTGYPRELNQVWTNLVLNAVEAMPGGGTLTVRTCREGDAVVVEISDSGVGIPEDMRARMFQPFFTTKDVGRGPGLGLHLVHEIVARRHGGSITVASAAGDTRVAVRLPINRPAAASPRQVIRGGRVRWTPDAGQESAEHLTK